MLQIENIDKNKHEDHTFYNHEKKKITYEEFAELVERMKNDIVLQTSTIISITETACLHHNQPR